MAASLPEPPHAGNAGPSLAGAGAGPGRPILEPGRTCWRIAGTGRLSVIVDAEDYFTAAKAALRRARRSVYLTAWDFDARLRLTPQLRRPHRPDRLGHLLNWLATSRPDLRIHVLKWDYAELFDLARWSRPFLLRNGLTHPRLQYRLDGDHPTGACHHQKMLVIDDGVAFCGGLDLTANRWDTRAHRAREPLRRQPDGRFYEPFHDVMMAVDGDAARAMGDLFRERWRRATGEELAPPAPSPTDPWPPALRPLVTGARVGIARTDPACNGRAEVREVEALHREAIAQAKRSIYLESQYFASTAVTEALKARLAEPDGPDIVVVNPARTTSWLENTVMLGARARIARDLRAADRHGRFALYAAKTGAGGGGGGGVGITVHAKVMVVDDRLLRVGSANLNNRSMGLDTECDLALEAHPDAPEDAAARAAITATRDDLIAEHLGVTPDRVSAEIRRRGSLIAAIEALRQSDAPPSGGRTLEPLIEPEPDGLAAAVAEAQVFDPERPVDAVDIVRRVLPSRIPRTRHWLMLLGLLALAAGLWEAWRDTGLDEEATLHRALGALRGVGETALAPLWLALAYVAGGFLMLPLTLMIAATAVALGPWWGFPTALAGALASATALFWVGRLAGGDRLERYGGALVAQTNRRLTGRRLTGQGLKSQGVKGQGVKGRDLPAIAGLRAAPAAPFTVANLVAGASGVGFADYAVGTVVGLIPSALAFTWLGHQLQRTMATPSAGNIALLVGLAVFALRMGWLTDRLLGARQGKDQP